MKNPLSRFPVRLRLLSILLAFSIPVGLLSYLLHMASTTQIAVARDEIAGTRYIAPLVELLNDVADYQMSALSESRGRKPEKPTSDLARRVEERLGEIANIDAELGAELKTTAEDLAKAKHAPISIAELAKEWKTVSSARYSGENFERLSGEISDIISYVEGTSQLALDPDIDSYMLMAASVELLPRTLGSIAQLKSRAFEELENSKGSIAVQNRPAIMFIQKTIQDFLLPSVLGNIEKSLDTDAETNGSSPTLKTTMSEAVATYQKAANSLMETTKALLDDDKKSMTPEAYVGIADAMHDGCSELAAKGLNELKTLLELRIQGVQSHEFAVFSAVAVGVALSLLMYFVAAASISRPLQQIQKSMERIVGGDTDFEVETDTARNETSALTRALASLRATVAEAFKHKQMIEDIPINVMVVDPKDGSKITYANKTSLSTLRTMESHLPVKADKIVGNTFDVFHKVSAEQRRILANGENLPCSDIIKIGPETLQLKISAIRNAKGDYIGPMVAWTVITSQEKLANDFEKNVLGVVDTLNKSTEGLNSSAETLSSTAESTSRLSTAVAGAATQASANVQTVAAATEELTASIGEISRQVKEARQCLQSS